MSETSTPSHPIRLRCRYAPTLQQILAGQGEWVEIATSTLTGESRATKQARLLQAARQREIKINTTWQSNGKLYARLVVGENAAVSL
jgi:hypothetical protein